MMQKYEPQIFLLELLSKSLLETQIDHIHKFSPLCFHHFILALTTSSNYYILFLPFNINLVIYFLRIAITYMQNSSLKTMSKAI